MALATAVFLPSPIGETSTLIISGTLGAIGVILLLTITTLRRMRRLR